MNTNHLRFAAVSLLSASLALAVLAGCATSEHVQRFDDGWKAGHVKAVGTALQLGEQNLRLDCRPADGADAATATFALVSYPHGKTWRSVVAPVSPDLRLAVSQKVWVNSRRCDWVETHAGPTP